MQFLQFSNLLWRSQRLRRLIERERRRPQDHHHLRLLRLQVLLLRAQNRLADLLTTAPPAMTPVPARCARRQSPVLANR